MKIPNIFILFVACFIFSLSFHAQPSVSELDRLILAGSYYQADSVIDESLPRLNPSQKAIFLLKKGKVKVYLSLYEEAIDLFFQSKELATKNIQNQLIVENDYLLGKTFLIIGDKERGSMYFQKVIDNPMITDTMTLIKTYYSLSFVEMDSIQAIKHLQKAISLVVDFDSLSLLSYEIKANYYFKINELDKAIESWRKQSLSKESNIHNQYEALNCMAYAYDSLKEYDSAIFYYKKGIELTMQANNSEVLKSITLQVIKILNKEEKYEEASFYQDLYNQALRDTASLSVEDFRRIYEAESKHLNKQEVSYSYSNYLWVASTFLAIIFIFVFLYFKKSKQQALKLEEKNKSTETTYFSSPELDKEISEKLLIFEETKGYLQTNCTLKALTEKFKLKNQKYLSDYIRKNLEKTFPQYINDLRIEYIISQWKTEEKFRNYSIESISKEAGFKARSSFLSAFKEKTGETPSGYKEKHFN